MFWRRIYIVFNTVKITAFAAGAIQSFIIGKFWFAILLAMAAAIAVWFFPASVVLVAKRIPGDDSSE